MNSSLTGPRFTALHGEIVDRVECGQFPSVSIGVIQDGHVLWRESIGFADKENQRPATPNTPYGLASLGNSITASAVMVLVDRLEVNLNAPISHYIGEDLLTMYEGSLDQVTLRRVLNMTAGIPNGHMIFRRWEDLSSYPIDELVSNRGLVVFPPGEVYLYSNFAYALLEKLIEDVSGRSFQEFLQLEIYDLLDMRSSYICPNKGLEITSPALLYHQDDTRNQLYYPLPQSSFSIYGSLNDMLNFAKFQLGSKEFIHLPFNDRTLEKMHDLSGEAPGGILTLGFARANLDNQHYWLLTNGRAGGMQATLSLVPSEGLAVICLINSTGKAADDLTYRITDLLLPGFLDRALQIMDKYEAWASQPYQPTADLLGDWSGVVHAGETQIPIELSFFTEGAIQVAFGGGFESYLTSVGYRNGLLSGDFHAILPFEEAQYEPHKVRISLKLIGTRLSGLVNSEINNSRGNFSLAGYVNLIRTDKQTLDNQGMMLVQL